MQYSVKKSIYVGIVTFNPELTRLQENLSAISPQVERIVICDNGSMNFKNIQSLLENYSNITVLSLQTNSGIAHALNQLMNFGMKHDYDWMLALDQDSVCSDDYLRKLQRFIDFSHNIGIIAPTILDRNIGSVGHEVAHEYRFVRTCITSGALYRIDSWSKVDGYDESMFIDSVDFEYCYRIRKAGFKILLAKEPRLLQEVGHSEYRRFLFFKVLVNNHSAFRKFYIARNNVYFPLKHHLSLFFIRGVLRNILLLLKITLYETDKKKKIKSSISGWREGMRAGLEGGKNAH